jgi:hypothetical protein
VSPSKHTCFLTKLIEAAVALYVFNRLPNMPVPTYVLDRTVEFRMHMKTARATLIFVQYLVRDSFPGLQILKWSKELFGKRVLNAWKISLELSLGLKQLVDLLTKCF